MIMSASPQTENGYLKIANELMEALLKIRIPGEARQFFDTVMRQTYGFHKIHDKIATIQFMEFTGLSRNSIHRARKKLLKMGLITVSQKGYSDIRTYSIQKDYHKWKVLPKKDTVSQKDTRCIPKRIQGVCKKGRGVYPKKGPTKDTFTKDTIKDTLTKDRWIFLKDKDFEIAFNDYLTMRLKIRRLATPRAQELVLTELHKYDIKTAIAMLEQSIINSWQGVFPLKDKRNLTKAQQVSVQSMDKLNQRLKEEGYAEN